MSYCPKGLGHVVINVKNLQQAVDWYCDLLDLHVYDLIPHKMAFLSADLEKSHELALIEIGRYIEPQKKPHIGLSHLAWQMESLDDLKELYYRLLAKGIRVSPSDHGISFGLYFSDLDGNGVEAYYELPRSQWPVQERLFSSPERPHNLFPGPWDIQ